MRFDKKIFKEDLILLISSVLIGLFSGILGIIYRLMIGYSNHIVNYFISLIKYTKNNPINILYLLIFLGIMGLLAGYLAFLEPNSSGSGIPQVTAEINDKLIENPIKVIITKLLGGFFASLGGLSLGREGPSIQLGAMGGKLISKILKNDRENEKILITSGASAGLSVAFNAPLAGTIFSLEEVHHKFNKKLILSCIVAASTADLLSHILFNAKPIFDFSKTKSLNLKIYIYIVLFGIILGLFGTFYNILMKVSFSFYKRFKNPILKVEIAMLLSFIMFISLPTVLTSGHFLVEKLIYTSYGLIFLIILYFTKTFFSCFSFSSGVAGGIFLPILVQGAILGAIFSHFVGKEYISLFIVLSMASYLTAIVRSPITSIILIFEMTASISFFLPLMVCVIFSYFTANVLGTLPIYDYLLERLLDRINSKK